MIGRLFVRLLRLFISDAEYRELLSEEESERRAAWYQSERDDDHAASER